MVYQRVNLGSQNSNCTNFIDALGYQAYRSITSQLTPASGISINNVTAQVIGKIIVLGIHFTTTANIAENATIISNFKCHPDVNTFGFILSKNASRDLYVANLSRNGSSLANLITKTAIPSGTDVRGVVCLIGDAYF